MYVEKKLGKELSQALVEMDVWNYAVIGYILYSAYFFA